jgi:hypothetical protein
VVEETTPTNLPSSRSPDVDTPNGRTPDVDTPNSRPKTPDVDTPNGRTPEIDTPNARTPNVDTPNPARVEPEAPAPRNADGTADISDATPESVPARDSSVSDSGRIESDQLSDRQIRNELDYLKDNPNIVEGTPPNRKAKIGEHEWHEQPGGGWCRHSDGEVCVLKEQVRQDAESIIANANPKTLKQQAATARASSPEAETTMTDAFQNTRPSRASAQGFHTFENFPGFQLKERVEGETIMVVSNPNEFMKNIERIYRESGEPLHPKMKDKIRGWIGEPGREFSSLHGIPGLHAEVRAANQRLNKLTEEGVEITDEIVEQQVQIAVYRVAPDSPTVKQGDPFPACRNCKNILKGFNILTGEVPD